MSFSLFSFAAVFFSSAVAAMGLGGGTVLLLYLSFFSTLSQPQMQSLNLLLFLPAAGLSLYFHTKNKLVCTAVLPRCILSGAVGGVISNRIDPQLLRRFFGIFLLCIGLREGYLAAKLICKNFFHRKA